MLSYCLKCRKNKESKNPKLAKTTILSIMFYQNVQCVIVKNQILSKSKNLMDY